MKGKVDMSYTFGKTQEEPVTVLVIKWNLSEWFSGWAGQRRAHGPWSLVPLPATLENPPGRFPYRRKQGTSQTNYIRISEIPIHMSIFLKFPERFYCAAKIENYSSSKARKEELTFRADSENGKEERNLKNCLKGKSIFLLKTLGKLFP